MSQHVIPHASIIAVLSELLQVAQEEQRAIHAQVTTDTTSHAEKAALDAQRDALSFRREVLEQGFIRVMGFADGSWGREATWIVDDRYRVMAYHDDEMPITCWSMSIFDRQEQKYILG